MDVDVNGGPVTLETIVRAVIDRIEVRGTLDPSVHSIPATFVRNAIDLPDFGIPVVAHGDVAPRTIHLMADNRLVGRISNIGAPASPAVQDSPNPQIPAMPPPPPSEPKGKTKK